MEIIQPRDIEQQPCLEWLIGVRVMLGLVQIIENHRENQSIKKMQSLHNRDDLASCVRSQRYASEDLYLSLLELKHVNRSEEGA